MAGDARPHRPDLRALGAGELVTAFAAIGLLVVMFVPWYRVAVGGVQDVPGGELVAGPEADRNAWQAFAVNDIVLAVLAAFVLVSVAVVLVRGPVALLMTLQVGAVYAGFVTIVLIALRIILRPEADDVVATEPGAWLGLGCAVVMTVGAAIAMRSDGTDRALPGDSAENVKVRPLPPPSEPDAGGAGESTPADGSDGDPPRMADPPPAQPA
jgi:hypothetical protein